MKLKTPILTRLTLGDWSGDGHEETDQYVFQINYPVADLQQAYKDSCKKVGIQFNHNENYMGTGGNVYDQIFTEYGDNIIPYEEAALLRAHGILNDDLLNGSIEEDDEGGIYVTPDGEGKEFVANLIMRFIAASMPADFEYQMAKDFDIEPLNGWWNKNLNVQFGYGLYE